jgi:hypothetical protein
MFEDRERNIIIMALMYLQNDYTFNDLKRLGFTALTGQDGVEAFEDKVQLLLEDFVGPTWDAKGTAESIEQERKKCTRHPSFPAGVLDPDLDYNEMRTDDLEKWIQDGDLSAD